MNDGLVVSPFRTFLTGQMLRNAVQHLASANRHLLRERFSVKTGARRNNPFQGVRDNGSRDTRRPIALAAFG